MKYPSIRTRFLAFAIAPVIFLAAAPVALAATDGTPGTSSQGDLQIDLVIPKLIRVSGLQDIDLGTYNGDSVARSGSSDACVRGNDAFTYQVVATSDNGSFVLSNNGSTDIPYNVVWAGTDLTYNTALGGNSLDSTSLGSCDPSADGGQNRVAVNVPATGMDSATPGSYTDTLILTVSPE